MNRLELERLLIETFEIKEQSVLDSLYIYYEMLYETSKVMNLTTIVELEEAYIKHFYDSLLMSKVVDLTKELKLADIGTGAGFPGLVIKIVYPNLKVTLIEPIGKRCKFLQSVIDRLELKDIYVINERAEDAVKKYRESFDIVTARAVASLNILSEICVPFVKINGLFIALKGSSYQEEIDNACRAVGKLKVKLTKKVLLELPLKLGERSILVYKKTESTPDIYPRLYAKIKKNPL
ncbi:MAG: 16S rRNA (guanine(527)-N(7))-methyltransferase RsmG [Bacilli bacterium]|nr:16S rRNA (guanine(527)-N(7))-methyltransferase RsmG [Bacilli bacterium]